MIDGLLTNKKNADLIIEYKILNIEKKNLNIFFLINGDAGIFIILKLCFLEY